MDDTWITDWPVSTRFPHYTRANAGEVLADPVSPLGWTFGWDGGFQLLDGELDAYVADPSSFDDVLRPRHDEWRSLFELEPPFIIANGNVPPLGHWAKRNRVAAEGTTLSEGDSLTGVGGSPGTARGLARVVLDAGDPRDLQPGDVLIAPNTDPSWTSLFMSASAVVVEVGSPLSHAVIVSRELGLPCVVSAKDATTRIADGSVVEVDGTAGTVRIISTGATP